MHAYIITGKGKAERLRKTQELILEKGIKEVSTLITNNKHTIEAVRSLKQQLSLACQDPEKGRAVIIEDAQLLTQEAANAFLKSLEEPSGKTFFFLTAPRAEQALETIRSRCQEINLGNAESLSLDEDHAQERLKILLSLSLSAKLDYLDKIKDRQEASLFCQEMLFAARRLMADTPSTTTLKLVENIETARQDIENNVNIKLALGDLILQI